MRFRWLDRLGFENKLFLFVWGEQQREREREKAWKRRFWRVAGVLEREREMDFGAIFGSGVLIDELAFGLD